MSHPSGEAKPKRFRSVNPIGCFIQIGVDLHTATNVVVSCLQFDDWKLYDVGKRIAFTDPRNIAKDSWECFYQVETLSEDRVTVRLFYIEGLHERGLNSSAIEPPKSPVAVSSMLPTRAGNSSCETPRLILR